MPAHRKLLVVTALLAALALPSAAQALPQNSSFGGSPYIAGQPQPATPTYSSAPSPEVVVTGSSDSSFRWGDAGLGASVALAALLIAGGILVLVRSHRHESARFHLT